jgi:CoA:oxalate CoA-transferase
MLNNVAPTARKELAKPLEGILVLDFSQFLSGPLATLRMADLGARVIKIERPGIGDLGRSIYLSDTDVHGENTLFHAINRNKESYASGSQRPSRPDPVEAPYGSGGCNRAEFPAWSHGAAGT